MSRGFVFKDLSANPAPQPVTAGRYALNVLDNPTLQWAGFTNTPEQV
jgi:hypothetical protein